MIIFLICLIQLAAFLLSAQKNSNGLIKAEKNFAAYSVEHGTKEAFLHFLDSTAIIF